MTDYLSRTVSIADGSTDEFTLSFPYLNRSHVKVAIDDDEYLGGFTFLSPSTIQLADMPAADAVVTRYRQTELDELLATFQGKSAFNSAEADLITLQLLYLLQEATDLGLAPNVIVPQFISFMATENFAVGEICGPFAVPFSLELPVGAVGSVFRVPVPPNSVHVFSIRKNDASVVGTLSISSLGVVTPTVASSSSFAAGDGLSLVTTTDGGLVNFGATFKMLVP